jgi:arylsulfatase A-like enzyme
VVSNGTPLDERFDNVAHLARRAGYDPVLFGYTDTTVDPRTVDDADDPRLRTWESVLPGFRVVVDLPEHLRPWGEWLRARGHEVGDDVAASMYRRADAAVPPGRGSLWAPAIYPAEHTESAFLAESVIEHLGTGGDPFFVHASFLRPHPPYLVPAPYHDLYDPADVELPRRAATREEQGRVHPIVALATAFEGVSAPADELEVRQLRATYYGMITEVDAQLGRVVDHLRSTGRLDDTWVVVTSDHGEQLGDQWLVEKLGFFDASYRIPLVVRPPRPGGEAPATAGRHVDAFTENVDLLPTVADAIGEPVPLGASGRSLLPWVEGGTPAPWRDAAHFEWDFRRPDSDLFDDKGLADPDRSLCVLRDARGKYVHLADGPPVFFDLLEDPHETTDRAGDPVYRDTVLEYAQRMLSWRMSTDEELLARCRVGDRGVVWR